MDAKKQWSSWFVGPPTFYFQCFSIYTFGAKTVRSRKCLALSTNWTLVNFFITLCGITFGTTFVYLNLNHSGVNSKVFYSFEICFPLIFITLFTFSCLRYLKACCCYVFDISFIQQYGLDIESLQVVNIEELTSQSDIEMSPHVQAADDSDFSCWNINLRDTYLFQKRFFWFSFTFKSEIPILIHHGN